MKPGSSSVISRIAAAVLGGYWFTWGFTTLGITAAMAFGVTYGNAITTAYLLAFLVFLVAVLWAFSTRSLWRAWGVLAGGGALMTGAALLLARSAG